MITYIFGGVTLLLLILVVIVFKKLKDISATNDDILKKLNTITKGISVDDDGTLNILGNIKMKDGWKIIVGETDLSFENHNSPGDPGFGTNRFSIRKNLVRIGVGEKKGTVFAGGDQGWLRSASW